MAALYRRHAANAIRLAYLLTGDEALAEDLFHDAFIKISGRWGTLRDPEAFGGYLRRTIVNLSHSHHRRKAVERRFLERERGSLRPTPGAESLDHEADELWDQIQRLPIGQRQAIVLRFYEDVSDEEIAEILRCRPGTVRSRISRGLDALHRIRGGDRVGD
ncbi:MAG: SigE family RNA polymerase sigma factor [Actinomycetota bacterium]